MSLTLFRRDDNGGRVRELDLPSARRREERAPAPTTDGVVDIARLTQLWELRWPGCFPEPPEPGGSAETTAVRPDATYRTSVCTDDDPNWRSWMHLYVSQTRLSFDSAPMRIEVMADALRVAFE